MVLFSSVRKTPLNITSVNFSKYSPSLRGAIENCTNFRAPLLFPQQQRRNFDCWQEKEMRAIFDMQSHSLLTATFLYVQ